MMSSGDNRRLGLDGLRDAYEASVRTLVEWAQAYYVHDAPTVSDATYDQLYRDVAAIEATHPEWISPSSPTQRVGGAVLDRKSTRLNSSHEWISRMPSSA